MAVIGIDLGTTYSAASRCVAGTAEIINLEGRTTFPSVVSRQRGGKIAIGWTAKRNQIAAPHNTVVEVKRLMGDPDAKIKLGDKEFTPQDISSMILRRIKELAEEELGEEITGVVISCPAYFKDPARAATKEAGQLAGLNVLRIVNEPTAAAYAYGVRQQESDKEQLFLVYDLGGGTFDVTVIKRTGDLLEVIGTGGDPKLGGANFDDRIVEWMLDEIKITHPAYAATLGDKDRLHALRMRLKIPAEEAKIALCSMTAPDAAHQINIANVDAFQGRPVFFNGTLTRPMFEGMIRDLLDNSLREVDVAMKEPTETHSYTEADLTAVLLVGGSTRVPLVREVLEKRFPSVPVWGQERNINPDEIVAIGASLVAADADDTGAAAGPQSVLVDVTGHTLSVAVMDEQKGREVLVPLIPKDTPIPHEAEHLFSSYGRGQRQCRVRVFQGEGVEIDPQRVTMIAEFIIEIPPIDDPTPLAIGLNLDLDGILVAHATNQHTGQKVVCRVDYKDSAKIDPKELERRQKELQAQLQAVLGDTVNPLGDAPQQQPAAARPAPAAQPSPLVGVGFDPGVMNPIMRILYQKALDNFMRVPEERQGALMQLVSDIESAARAGDRTKVDGYAPKLTELLKDVS